MKFLHQFLMWERPLVLMIPITARSYATMFLRRNEEGVTRSAISSSSLPFFIVILLLILFSIHSSIRFRLIMIIRLESAIGTKRIEVTPDESTFSFIKKVQSVFGFPDLTSFNVYKTRSKDARIIGVERTRVDDLSLKHGDMVFVEVTGGGVVKNENHAIPVTQGNNNNHRVVKSSSNGVSISEDEVDQKLWKTSGLIERPPDEKLCTHGPNGKCLNCTPLEPYDEAYLKEHNIKHMSFHSYLRKMTRGVDKGKFAILENISCRLKPGCREHLPWPQGICTKCQPNAVTLNRQVYRHVDNVVFENAGVVERFLDYWRKTGHQRIGYLYGKHDTHSDVPLGIKATVVAIYEPPQETSADMVKLITPDKNAEVVESIASQLGLKKVGWIFTDLLPLDNQKGTVKNIRNADSHFLSAQECIMAGFFQNEHPNPCRLSPDGYFGSKIVTVCVTGNSENQIHMEGYQVSNQCMALVRDACLIPTKDAPELGFIKETSKEQFVPDVFFKEKDSFGNEVTKVGRPLPIEYLLVDVPVSTPVEPRLTFNPLQQKRPFPIENRTFIEGHLQDLRAVNSYLKQFSLGHQFLEAFSDFHLLIFLATLEMLPLNSHLGQLLDAIRRKDRKQALDWSQKCEEWITLHQLIQDSGASSLSSSVGAESSGPSLPPAPVSWNCSYCTFENRRQPSNCEMCGLPKNQSS